MKIKLLNEHEITYIYSTYMRNDFPPDELRPLSNILSLYHNKRYFVYGFYNNDSLRGYALFCSSEDDRVLLLDYFAVLKEYRNKGLGSLLLKQLKNLHQDRDAILIEAEDPEAAQSNTEKSIRLRRIEFYKRSGCIVSDVSSCVFGVKFVNIQLPCNRQLSDPEHLDYLKSIYKDMLSEEIFKKVTVFSLN